MRAIVIYSILKIVGGLKMYYGIDKNKLNLSGAIKIIEEVQELQKLLYDEGYELDFDQVLKIYELDQIKGYLEDLIPVE